MYLDKKNHSIRIIIPSVEAATEGRRIGSYLGTADSRLQPLGSFPTWSLLSRFSHGRFGFFMTWTGTQKVEGYEYHLIVLAAAALLMIRGAGAASANRLLSFLSKNKIKARPSRLARET